VTHRLQDLLALGLGVDRRLQFLEFLEEVDHPGLVRRVAVPDVESAASTGSEVARLDVPPEDHGDREPRADGLGRDRERSCLNS